ncbi:tRNA(Ile)-lysidine synthetase [Denitrovibrio acetiphilus DSM 12809]|uniref:tRNA(Ile)-lysidine synthase n=1 Tax=Denitrovibrio acetiphilus (strain DSM 12809 / NBRC 114555 / N2460) TaxID=522772 RepID=D4H7R7_DENA2|nr:tRNA lysidine(34) synthetase TilS [Denitrovibrio acetiphilus]ADD68066.1 tRNA(Ile)-lysidine synthetase [Denitrovibrio acetiphilus DSM 12809]
MTLSFEKKLSSKLGDFVGRRLLVAFSGGKDSVALLHFLKRNEGIQGYSVSACHINHLFRKTSLWDEKFCADFCEKLSIPFISYRADVPRYCEVKKMSFEHGARIVRYRALYNAMKHFDAELLLTAHTKNDVVETFFIHAVQGASVFSLKGITERDRDLFRPMLDISTEEILEYINRYKIKHAVDETNNDDSYLRNFIRNHITATLSEYRPGFENNILGIMHDAVKYDSYLEERLKPLINVSDGSVLAVERQVFDSLHEVEQDYLLHSMASQLFRVERRHIEDMKHLVETDYSVRIDMPDGYRFEKSDKLLRLFHKRLIVKFEQVKKASETELYVRHLGKMITFKGDWVDKELIVRKRAVGDRFGNKKLKDIFIDKKLDLFVRDTSLIILCDNCIVWVENISSDDTITVSVNRKNLEL